MQYKIEFKKQTRKEWLKEMPDVIYRLKKDYNFYYSCNRPALIKKEITEIINKGYERNRHKIVLYQRERRQVYLVVYAKKTVTVYYCNEYAYEQDLQYVDLDGKPTGSTGNKNQWAAIKRFMKKFYLAYEKAVKERIECSISNLMELNNAQ